ncbi:hypothetical protein CWC00_20935 [Pseudoalteromonas rubra]|nr:hypothetical protein CWC00_20935 [Pseudoalteromonas rubra]
MLLQIEQVLSEIGIKHSARSSPATRRECSIARTQFIGLFSQYERHSRAQSEFIAIFRNCEARSLGY